LKTRHCLKISLLYYNAVTKKTYLMLPVFKTFSFSSPPKKHMFGKIEIFTAIVTRYGKLWI